MDSVLAKTWETLDPKIKEEYGEGIHNESTSALFLVG
jgi:hypothetical protein